MNINSVILGGRLTRDVELRHAASGTAVASFGLAVSRYHNGEQETTFVDVTCFGRTAELAAEYLHKGSTAVVEGRLHLDEWTDPQSKGAGKRSRLKVIAERVHFGDRPKAADTTRHDEGAPQPVSAGVGGDDGPTDPPDDEVPF